MHPSRSIIYVAPSKASFIVQDIEWLSKKINVDTVFFTTSSKVLVPLKMLQLFVVLLFKRKQDILVSFGGYHAFICSLISKLKGSRCFIILNGTDSASIPTFNYGFLRGGLMRFCCKKAYEWAERLLPVSDTLMSTKNNYALNNQQLGITNEFKKLKTPFSTIPNGFDTKFWKPSREQVDGTILTVATNGRLIHKGVDLIIDLAKQRPDYTFSIAGVDFVEDRPENVIPLGFLTKSELRDAYSLSQYYFQLSIWEGFGCALCEAILCGCIPIVSDVNSLPEIVGKDGAILKKRSSKDLEILFEQVTSNTQQYSDLVTENYPIQQRINSLLEVLA